ncbi:MAG: hypothetical protein AAF266_16075 [Planctomycetota bacterium]
MSIATEFDPAAYGSAFAEVIGSEPVMPLGVGKADAALRSVLEALTVESAFAEATIVDRGSAECCLAGVWLLHGFLDEAHAICQDVPSPAGSYWHGVMHRREGDFGNAAYWFRRAGSLPIDPLLASAASASPETIELALGGQWDSAGFVEHVQRARRTQGDLAASCLALQRAEWRVLFDWCWREALGSSGS